MIVVAIVGILAAVAIPSYQDYVIRSKMAEPMTVLAEVKTAAAEYWAQKSVFPTTADLGKSAPNLQFLSDLEVSPSIWSTKGAASDSQIYLNIKGYIKLSISNEMWGVAATGRAKGDLVLQAEDVGGTLKWTCFTGSDTADNKIPKKYLPAGCVVPEDGHRPTPTP